MVAVQAEIANHPKVRRLRAVRAERCGKRRVFERVRCDPMKANVSEPWMTCRNALDDIKTKLVFLAWDESGGSLLTGQVVSGIYAARAWVRLLYGTWEPVVPRNGWLVVFGLRPVVQGKAPSGRNRKERGPGVGHRGGSSCSSDESLVMRLERRGRAIPAWSAVNHELVGGAGV